MRVNEYLINITLEKLKQKEYSPLCLYGSGDDLRSIQNDKSPISIRGAFLEHEDVLLGFLGQPESIIESGIDNSIKLEVMEMKTLFKEYLQGNYYAFETFFAPKEFKTDYFEAIQTLLEVVYPYPYEKLLKNTKNMVKNFTRYPVFSSYSYINVLQILSYCDNLFNTDTHSFVVDDKFLINNIMDYHLEDKELDNDYSITMNNDINKLMVDVEGSFHNNKNDFDMISNGDYEAMNDWLVDLRQDFVYP